MASRPRSSQPTQVQRGYNLKPVRLPLDRKYICPEGEHILKNPVQTACGERFCRECADSLLRQSNPHCPVCNEPMKKDEVFRDAFAERETLALEVFCKCKDDGCDWQGALREYEAHQLVCLHHLVPCPDACGMVVAMTNMERHQEKECSQRPVECSYCHIRVAASMLDSHNRDQCQYQPVICSYCSAGPMPRNELERHLNTVCQDFPVLCRYSVIGCQEKMPRKGLDDHDIAFSVTHLALTVQTITAHKREAEREAESQRREVECQKREVECQKRKTQDLAREVAELKANAGSAVSAAMAAVHPIANEVAVQVAVQVANEAKKEVHNEVQKKLEERVQPLESQVREQGRTLARHDSKAAEVDLRADHLEYQTANGVLMANTALRQVENVTDTVGRLDQQLLEQGRAQGKDIADLATRALCLEGKVYGELVWKIGDVGRRRREAISGRTPSLYSAPFYTSPAGYKMCARIYLNGDGIGRDECLSLFFVIMKGEHDAILPWPFQLKVTMSLIDQSQPEVFRHDVTRTSEPGHRSASFERPESEMNEVIGFPEFALLNVIDSPTSEYIRDDTIFIKTKVDERSLTV